MNFSVCKSYLNFLMEENGTFETNDMKPKNNFVLGKSTLWKPVKNPRNRVAAHILYTF